MKISTKIKLVGIIAAIVSAIPLVVIPATTPQVNTAANYKAHAAVLPAANLLASQFTVLSSSQLYIRVYSTYGCAGYHWDMEPGTTKYNTVDSYRVHPLTHAWVTYQGKRTIRYPGCYNTHATSPLYIRGVRE